jgi:hypothetical protein
VPPADLLDRRIVGPGAELSGDQELAEQCVRAWCDWWHSLSG